MDLNVVNTIMILLAASVIVVAVFRRLQLPSILAYLLVGVIIGPYGLAWVPHTDDTHFLAEFGVVFLLFTIGLEFSLARLSAMKKEVLGLGSAQVIFATLLTGSIAWLLGIEMEVAVVLGGVLAMSSTAIVIKQLKDQQELGLPHGRLSVAILLFQDIAVVPFLILVAVLSENQQGTLLWELSWAMLKGLSVIGIMLLLGWWVLRPLFAVIVSTRSSELFTLAALLFAMAAAWLSHFAGLSFALGAFLAGMILGETEFRHQIEADIRPFRDVLLGLFFVVIGMMLNIHVLPNMLHWVLLLVLVIIVFKVALIMGLSLLFGFSRGVGLRTGIALGQAGEFGLALLTISLNSELIDTSVAQLVLAAMIISMGLAPLLIHFNGRIRNRLCANDCNSNVLNTDNHPVISATDISNHVIIAGYGDTGSNLGQLLQQKDFNYVGLDTNAARVHKARKHGDNVNYGDASHQLILDTSGLAQARVVVITYGDVQSIEKTIDQIKVLHPNIPILVWARNENDAEHLRDAGASEVIPRNREAHLMLESHLLRLLGIPLDDIVMRIQSACSTRYPMFNGFFRQ
ncbi:MAG: monovalent cation:proton antiporter-2 (CPA2) family protein [Gammaproteobacteria bacterium]|nr:monovalent cation:proton antiporter-2 (CPA2) family protein [Gammaproteobacteria bacterium]